MIKNKKINSNCNHKYKIFLLMINKKNHKMLVN